ncbi:polysaccharide biosynthesis/export family protein [Vibrio sp. PP-XX7]
MISQLQQLPEAEKQALARQYGVDPSTLGSQSKVGGATSSSTVQTIQPRSVNEKQSDESSSTETKDKYGNNKQLTDFGYDLFAGQTSSYTPIDDLPVPNNYLIAAGDEIDVQLFGSQNKSYSFNVSRDGNIQFPELGPIYVAGQTFSELKAHLTKRIKAQLLGVEVSISLGSLRMMQIYVTGDAYRPGAYNIPSLATVTQALIAAGASRKVGH